MTNSEHRAARRLGAVRFVCYTPAPTPPRRVNRWPLRILEVVLVAVVALAAHGILTM